MHGRLKEIYELKTFVPDRNSNKYLFFKFIFMNHVFFFFCALKSKENQTGWILLATYLKLLFMNYVFFLLCTQGNIKENWCWFQQNKNEVVTVSRCNTGR